MLQMIKKDLCFNWKWALILAAVAVLVPVACYWDHEGRLILMAYIIGDVLANSHFISRSCYLDDSEQTRRFLAALPVRRSRLVLAKYALALMCAATSIALTSLSLCLLCLRASVQGAMLAGMYLLLYYAVFLGAFYRSNYRSAERAHTGLMMLTVMSAFVLDRSGFDLEAMAVSPAALWAGLGICGAIFAASAIVSVTSSRCLIPY